MYWLVSLPWLDGSDDRTWQLLQNKARFLLFACLFESVRLLAHRCALSEPRWSM